VRNAWRKGWVKAVVGLFAVVLIAVVGMGAYVAGQAGDLPWQTDPTRISVVPFSDIPGFTAPTLIPTATAAAGTPTP
jgi:hypothetical protein